MNLRRPFICSHPVMMMMDTIVFAIVGLREGVVKRIPAGVLIRMEAVAESSFRVFFRFRGLQIAFSLIVLQVGCCYLI